MKDDKTSDFLNKDNQALVNESVGNTSTSFSGIDPYIIELPANINIFESLTDSISTLTDDEVIKQTRQVLGRLYFSLQRKSKNKALDNYLSRINLVQREDNSILLEWNFQDFRIGFTIEPQKDESAFFIIAQDKNKGSFSADAQKLNTDSFTPIDEIVGYVLENT
jgi:hypothetical protein